MSEFFRKKLEDYTEQPNPELWESIASGVKHANKVGRIRKASVISAVSLAVIAGAVALTNSLLQEDTRQAAIPTVAQQTTTVVNETVSTPASTTMTEENIAPEQVTAKVPANVTNQEKQTVSATPKAAETPVKATEEKESTTTVKQVNEPKTVAVAENATGTVSTNSDVQQRSENKPIANATPKVGPSSSSSSDDNTDNASESTEILIPNAFLPDAGGENSRFHVKPVNTNNIKDYEIRIFSRGGMMVFHSKTLTEAWDGTYKGSKLQAGAYAYVIGYTDNNGQKHAERGTVTIVR